MDFLPKIKAPSSKGKSQSVPSSPQGNARAQSVPCSPTGVNPATRSSKGGTWSPRTPSSRGVFGAPPHGLTLPTPVPQPAAGSQSSLHAPASLFRPNPLVLPPSAPATPTALSASVKASPATSAVGPTPADRAPSPRCGRHQAPRALLWAAVLLAFNYLGYRYPLLWSPSERETLLHALHGPEMPDSATLAQDFHQPQQHRQQQQQQQEEDAARVRDLQHGSSGRRVQRRSLVETSSSARLQMPANTAVDRSAFPGASPSPSPTPYVSAWSIQVASHKACRRVHPRHLVRANQGPIAFVGDLLRKHQRLLLTIPRHGLGNSLRGYVSAFVYAAVSGRRLVRFHGLQHAKVLDTLCHAFECGLESISAESFTQGDALTSHEGARAGAGASLEALEKQLDRQLGMLNPVDLNSKFKTSAQVLSSLRSTRGLFVSKSPHFFDGFWQAFPNAQACVYAAFGCSSTWCVHSRALHALVGPPTPLLQEVISHVLMAHVGPGTPDIPARRSQGAMFDIALHLRTRPAAIESTHSGAQSKPEEKHLSLMRTGCGQHESSDAAQYLQGCLWDCLGSVIQKLVAARAEKGRPLEILLATDNEDLRPAFVQRLARYGTVFYSSGAIVHSSKSAGDEAERLPTMAEFYLMSRAHTILEAGSYVSTFAYFSGLLGNGTLAGISWHKDGGCGLRVVHQGQLAASTSPS